MQQSWLLAYHLNAAACNDTILPYAICTGLPFTLMPLHRRLSDQAIGNNKQIQRNATQRKSCNTRLKSDSHDMILLAISQLRHWAPKPPACLFCRTSDVAAAKSPHAKFINTNRSSDGCSGYRSTQARDRGDRSNKQSLGPSVLTRLVFFAFDQIQCRAAHRLAFV